MKPSDVVLTVLALVVVALGGCATGGELKMIGTARPAVADHSTVEILTEMPAVAEPIAELQAQYNPRLDGPGSADVALDELRQQAASVGANAIVLTSKDGIYVFDQVPVGSNVMRSTPSLVTILKATAVWDETRATPVYR